MHLKMHGILTGFFAFACDTEMLPHSTFGTITRDDMSRSDPVLLLSGTVFDSRYHLIVILV